MKYRKKPVVIEAIQYTGKNVPEIMQFIDNEQVGFIYPDTLIIKTLEGEMRADPGKYIIKGIEGEFYPCDAGIFHKTYEKVDD